MKFPCCSRWDGRGGRIMRMILDEAAMLGLFGGIVGVALGVIGVKILGASPAIRGLSQARSGHCTPDTLCPHRRCGRNHQWTLSSLAKLATKSQSCLAERMRSAQFNRTMRNYSGHISSTVKLLFASFITVACLLSILRVTCGTCGAGNVCCRTC